MRSARVHNGPGPLGEIVEVGPHKLVSDEPAAEGGNDAGPTPRELLLGALGACTAATIRMYAARKGWKIENVDVELELIPNPSGQAKVKKTVRIVGELLPDQRARCEQIASRCPVHRLLTEGVSVDTTFV